MKDISGFRNQFSTLRSRIFELSPAYSKPRLVFFGRHILRLFKTVIIQKIPKEPYTEPKKCYRNSVERFPTFLFIRTLNQVNISTVSTMPGFKTRQYERALNRSLSKMHRLVGLFCISRYGSLSCYFINLNGRLFLLLF